MCQSQCYYVYFGHFVRACVCCTLNYAIQVMVMFVLYIILTIKTILIFIMLFYYMILLIKAIVISHNVGTVYHTINKSNSDFFMVVRIFITLAQVT